MVIMTVLEFPPKESRSRRVSLESMYGTCSIRKAESPTEELFSPLPCPGVNTADAFSFEALFFGDLELWPGMSNRTAKGLSPCSPSKSKLVFLSSTSGALCKKSSLRSTFIAPQDSIILCW